MNRSSRLARLLASLLVFAFCAIAGPPLPAAAQAATGTIAGALVTQTNGLGIGAATVTLYQGDTVSATTTSDADGRYQFSGLAPGVYSILISATGYQSTRISSVVVAAGASASVRTPLLPATTSTSGETREIIGTTQTTGLRGNTLAASSTIQYNLDTTQLLQQGFLKAADALGQLPGVNLSGSPHTYGDDTSLDIRGLGPGEVRPLIDGHPVGPIGVYNVDYYNYVNSPYSLLQNIQVTEGSGASGLYGVDVIGGTIDFQTLQPTKAPHLNATQQYGDDGTLQTIVTTTGSIGNFSYALGHAVTGTYGQFPPQYVFQGARPNNSANLPNGGACTASNDISTCNTVLNTYPVSGVFKTLSDLGKIRYNFTPSTALTLTAYASNTFEDSTGNGDNDDLPYATRLAGIQASGLNGTGGCAANLYPVITDASPNSCYTAQQWAAASYGPDGGGQNRTRGTTLQDFNATFTTTIANNAISIDTYSDYYNFHKFTNSGLDPTGTFLDTSGSYTDNYLSHGFLITDDIASATNDVGFGYFVEHQQDTGNNAYLAADNTIQFSPQPNLGEGDYSFFLRDNFTPTPQFAVFLNAWDRRSSVTQHTSFDPRISFVYKPTSRDIVRLTGGEADGDPGVNVVQANALSGFDNPSSLNPVCGAGELNAVATGGNPALLPERSKDLEAAYGHRFWSDTSINVVAYSSSVFNQLFSGVFPITAQALQNPAIGGTTNLTAFANKINSICNTNYNAQTVTSVLGLNGVFNASQALFRGIETTGRIRVTPQFALDYDYDIQSSQQFNEPLSLLLSDPFLLDGGQIVGIPLQKGSLTFDYANRGFETQIQGYFVGNNNTLNRPAYTFFNGFASKRLTKQATITLSVSNMFNQEAQQYGYFGEQLPHAVNQFHTQYSDPVQQYLAYGGTTDELIGLETRLIVLSISLKI